ncbi:required for excision 1-B domain-containing protein isoform X1 [Homo sapiens]|uniref:required for excision 1-B domain-containing protein isoform X1 n=1 Tax=Homo sapiens TaxID=9606 RepID=UPI0000246E72|nr:required for excision 1-B domain-containing protein isoform X1 [Homo sapiens]|eukprot:XP_024307339.1 required for excision 1-B domain-containing protein isoform X1 [Homo sapiens]
MGRGFRGTGSSPSRKRPHSTSPLPDDSLFVASLSSPRAGVGLSRVPLRESGSVLPTYQSSPLVSGDTSWGPFRWLAPVQGLRAWGRGLRVPTCRRGHRQYLRSGPDYDFARYRSTVHGVTQAFAAASREVLAVEAELGGPRRQPLLAGHVRSLQELEQTRLGTVALLQLMETPELAGQEDAVRMQQLKMKVIKTMEAISEVLQDLRFDAESAE